MHCLFLVTLCFVFSLHAGAEALPQDFVDVQKNVPRIVVDARYYGEENFVGSRVDGYEAPVAYLTAAAAKGLRSAQAALKAFGLGLKVFDAYRPQRAVNHFVRWAKELNDTKMKARYYPHADKSRLFAEGYIAAKSGHSRGSTVDLTLIDLTTGRELDMGTGFDYFGPESHATSTAVTAHQRANRMLLRSVMTRFGFRPLPEEWWHFTLENEPYPQTYFDAPVR